MVQRKRTDTVPQYDLEALKRNLERCERNIALCLVEGWHKSMEKEVEEKLLLQRFIDEIERR